MLSALLADAHEARFRRAPPSPTAAPASCAGSSSAAARVASCGGRGSAGARPWRPHAVRFLGALCGALQMQRRARGPLRRRLFSLARARAPRVASCSLGLDPLVVGRRPRPRSRFARGGSRRSQSELCRDADLPLVGRTARPERLAPSTTAKFVGEGWRASAQDPADAYHCNGQRAAATFRRKYAVAYFADVPSPFGGALWKPRSRSAYRRRHGAGEWAARAGGAAHFPRRSAAAATAPSNPW